jgi:hypothetical protein
MSSPRCLIAGARRGIDPEIYYGYTGFLRLGEQDAELVLAVAR